MTDPAAARAETERYHRALYTRRPDAAAPADAWRTRPSPHVLRAAAAVPDLRIAVDLGCGEGRHAVPIALAAPHARVLGVDLLPEALAGLRARAAEAGVADRVAATFTGWSVVEHSAGPQHAREVRGGEPHTLVGTMLRWTLRRPGG